MVKNSGQAKRELAIHSKRFAGLASVCRALSSQDLYNLQNLPSHCSPGCSSERSANEGDATAVHKASAELCRREGSTQSAKEHGQEAAAVDQAAQQKADEAEAIS